MKLSAIIMAAMHAADGKKLEQIGGYVPAEKFKQTMDEVTKGAKK